MKRRSTVFILGSLTCVVATWLALRFAPLPAALRSPAPVSTEFLDRSGKPLRLMLVEDRAFSSRASLEEISPHLISATIAAEDARFFSHPGFDPFAASRAIFNALRRRPPLSGASTITQQLVKNPNSRSFSNKLSEVFHALSLERKWSKKQILEEYLNRLDYGNLRIGIASASRYYLGKPPSDLSPAEAAFLASLPNAPTRLNPHRNFTGAQERQQWILRRMAASGLISNEELHRALSENLHLQSHHNDFAAPHFVDLLLQRRGTLPSAGGRIRTTLDIDLTHHVERALSMQLARLLKHNASGAAAVVLHNPSGEVLALAGSGDYFSSGAGQVNGAWIPRSSGSTLKPFTYLLAIEKGANPATIVPDIPTSFKTATGTYRPNNYNHRFYGPVSLRNALGNSLNVAAIRTLQLAGGPEALHHLLRDLGITTLDHPADYYGLGLTLGNAETRLLELANAYGTIARGGLHLPFRLLLPIHPASPTDGSRVFNKSAAYIVSNMLADNRARAAAFGLNSFLNFPFPVACKTGTSSDYRDNWAIGYTPEFTVAVWVGNPDGRPMRNITGVTGAAPAMHDIFTFLHATRGTSWFARPPDVHDGLFNPLTGHLVAEARSDTVRDIFIYPPPLESPDDTDSQGRTVLPSEYRQWLASSQNGLGDSVSCPTVSESIHIVSPSPGSTFFLDPDIPRTAQRIPLLAESPAPVQWSSDTLQCDSQSPHPTVILTEGVHTITGKSLDQSASTWIIVRSL